MKFIKIALLFVWMAAVSGVVSAQTLNTKFGGWIGKKQHGYILDPSSYVYCFGNNGGECATIGKMTGNSDCKTTGFNIGAKWAIPTKIGSMEINASANKSWTACNLRSETVSCKPNKGYKGRAVINFSERYGKIAVRGGQAYFNIDNYCAAGWKPEWMGGTSWRCNYVGGKYTVKGYLPEWRGSSCQYKKI